MHNIENYIFDLDGTIINSSEEVLLCFKKAFEKANYKINNSLLTPNLIGPPLKKIIETIAPELTDEHIIKIVMQNFRQIYDYDENDISKLYKGIFDLLTELKNLNKKIFIATFKPTKPTMRIVKQFKLDMFDDIYTIDKFEKPISKEEMLIDIIEKYNLVKEETIMVGDAASDMIAAKNAGIKGIGVLWGYGENKQPLINNSDLVVKDVKDLKECLKLNYQTI